VKADICKPQFSCNLELTASRNRPAAPAGAPAAAQPSPTPRRAAAATEAIGTIEVKSRTHVVQKCHSPRILMGLFGNMLFGIAGVGTVIGFNAYLATAAVPNSPPVPAGKTRICVAVRRPRLVAALIYLAADLCIFIFESKYIDCARAFFVCRAAMYLAILGERTPSHTPSPFTIELNMNHGTRHSDSAARSRQD
jgi:hypothetical protein